MFYTYLNNETMSKKVLKSDYGHVQICSFNLWIITCSTQKLYF